MKKKKIAVSAFVILSALLAFTKQALVSAQPANLDVDKALQESERNRELLEIWKAHVKTLTKERDDAFKQIEKLKMTQKTGPMAQFGGVETAALPPSQQVQALQSEVTKLKQQLGQRSSGAPASREAQMQLSALQSQFQQLKKELSDSRAEKERLIQEKEVALSQVEELQRNGMGASGSSQTEIVKNLQRSLDIQKKRYEELSEQYKEVDAENKTALKEIQSLRHQSFAKKTSEKQQTLDENDSVRELRRENARLKSELDVQSAAMRESGGQPDREKEAFMRQARELQYQNETLKAEVEKLQVMEKELNNTRAYFNPLVKDLQDKVSRLTSENASLREEAAQTKTQNEKALSEMKKINLQSQRFQKDAESISEEVERLKQQNQRLAADLKAAREEGEELERQVVSYKSQIQQAVADRDRYSTAEEEFKSRQAQYEALSKKYLDIEQLLKTRDELHSQQLAEKEQLIQQLNSQIATVDKSNRNFKQYESDYQKKLEKSQIALRANLQDMKNLKSNFEAYLESLVASFEDRQQ